MDGGAAVAQCMQAFCASSSHPSWLPARPSALETRATAAASSNLDPAWRIRTYTVTRAATGCAAMVDDAARARLMATASAIYGDETAEICGLLFGACGGVLESLQVGIAGSPRARR